MKKILLSLLNDVSNALQTNFPFFQALKIIKIIIFLQKYFPTKIPFDDIEIIRIKLTKKTSSWLTEKWNHSTPEDFSKYCQQTNNDLIRIAQDEKNPILKKAFMPREFDLTTLHWAQQIENQSAIETLQPQSWWRCTIL